MRLSACDHCTSSTLIGGKGGAGPSLLHITCLKDQWSKWMQVGCKVLKGFLHGIIWIMFHGHLEYIQEPPLGGRPNTQLGDHAWHSERSQLLIHSILSCVRTCMNRYSVKWPLVEGPITYDFTPHSRACDHTTWFWKSVLRRPLSIFLGSHNFMVMVFGSCDNWPLELEYFMHNITKMTMSCV